MNNKHPHDLLLKNLQSAVRALASEVESHIAFTACGSKLYLYKRLSSTIGESYELAQLIREGFRE